MKKVFLSLCCAFSFLTLYCQNGFSITGSIYDSNKDTALLHATITIIRSRDSILCNFYWNKHSPTFSMDGLNAGDFILIVSYPGYADYVQDFSLGAQTPTYNFGKIKMRIKAQVLQDAIVRGVISRVKIAGDTTEYAASNYKLPANSKVEDLLRQLPGIQVDQDGKITAQGQTVKKVLLDGGEFFGDDPTLITQNINADMVDKVQLYDKKSDAAALTGINDGQKVKTINIKLKDNNKNGLFGKVDAGIGTDGYYRGVGMFNSFAEKQRISAFGNIGNTGKIGLGWQDGNKYGTSSNSVQFGDAGNVYVLGTAGDDLESFNGEYNGQGIPIAKTAGLHYDWKDATNNQTGNINYKIGDLDVAGEKTTLLQQNLPGSYISSTTVQNFNNDIFRQKVEGSLVQKLDSISSVKISANATSKDVKSANIYLTTSIVRDTLLNSTSRSFNNNPDQQTFASSVLYSRKLTNKGRALSVLLSDAFSQTKENGVLNSLTNFYAPNQSIDSAENIKQYKQNWSKSSFLNWNLTYSEPLSKVLTIILNYGEQLSTNTVNRQTFDPGSPGKYDILDSLYSNSFKLNQFSNQLGVFLNYKVNKTTLSFGLKGADLRFSETNEYKNALLKRNLANWNAQVNYSYQLSKQTTIAFNYYGQTLLPTIDELQPVSVNIDPLNITRGDIGLKPSFNNDLVLSFNSYNALKEQLIWINAQYSFTESPIVYNGMTDSAGKTISQASNLPGRRPFTAHLFSAFNRKIKTADLTLGFNLNATGNTTYIVVNNSINQTSAYFFVGEATIAKSKLNKYNANLSFGPTYTIGKSSLQPSINNNGGGFTASGSFLIYFLRKFQFSSDAKFVYRDKTASFNTDYHALIINSSVSRTFLKKDNLKLSLSIKDLLSQNIGFQRTAFANTLVQNEYTTIRRYSMLSITWDFSKMNTLASKK